MFGEDRCEFIYQMHQYCQLLNQSIYDKTTVNDHMSSPVPPCSIAVCLSYTIACMRMVYNLKISVRKS